MMNTLWQLTIAALVLMVFAPISTAQEKSCGDYGTTVIFEKSPSDAAKKALKERKLVFVLHVSGLFENPEFT